MGSSRKNAALQVGNQWISRLKNEDAVDLPAAERHVDGTVPVLSEELPPADRQFIKEVHHAAVRDVANRHSSLQANIAVVLDRGRPAEPRLSARSERVVVDHLRHGVVRRHVEPL